MLKWLYLRVATGFSFGFQTERDNIGTRRLWRTTFDPASYGIGPTVLEAPGPVIPVPAESRPTVTFLGEGDNENKPAYQGYRRVVSELIDGLQKRGFRILLKAHPREGFAWFLNSYELPALPAGCPIELFDLKGVSAVIGLYSLALASAANQRIVAVSILNLLMIHAEETQDRWKQWLDQHSTTKSCTHRRSRQPWT